MKWTGPLDGGTWLDEPAVSPASKEQRKRIGRRLDEPAVSPASKEQRKRIGRRTVGGECTYLEERIAKAKELAKVYKRGKVAKMMKVDPSTVTKWLGAKYIDKRRWDRGG